jgi:hypothetical protein
MTAGWTKRAGGATALAAALLGTVAIAPPAAAHGLIVFAYVCTDTVVVEATFTTDRPMVGGVVRVFNGNDQQVLILEAGPEGLTRFPLPDYATGLRINVEAADEHTGYWILTPLDVAAQLTAPLPDCAA